MSVRSLPPKLQEKAINELNEVPDQIPEHLYDIKQWLSTQTDLKDNIDDQWILNFLRGCKFDIQRTKKKIEVFYTLRSKTPEFFNNRDPLLPEIQEILSRGILLPLRNTLDPSAPPVFMVRWEKADVRKTTVVNLVKVSLMLIDILINENDNFIVSGQQLVQDFNGFSAWYMLQITPRFCRKLIQCVQDAYPTRIKGANFVNVPSYFKILFNMVNPFLSKKLKQRVKVYGTNGFRSENIYKDIHPSVFPEEYGGEGGSVDELTCEWKQKMESYRDWFLQYNQ